MAKRFTDTDKWKKKFVRGLQGPYKLLWLYILDECDHAGVWIVDFDVAKLRLDEELNEQEALAAFGEKILKIDNGDKWLVLDFIEFQYGELKEENRAHTAVIKTLRKYGLWHEGEKVIMKNKPLTSPLQGAKEKEKEKDKEKEKEKEKGEIKILYPFESESFLNAWNVWKDYRKGIKKPYKCSLSEQAALKHLSEISSNDELRALKIIEQSIANQWQGLFEIKDNGTTKKQSRLTDRTTRAAELYKKYGGKLGEQGSSSV